MLNHDDLHINSIIDSFNDSGDVIENLMIWTVFTISIPITKPSGEGDVSRRGFDGYRGYSFISSSSVFLNQSPNHFDRRSFDTFRIGGIKRDEVSTPSDAKLDVINFCIIPTFMIFFNDVSHVDA